MKEKIDVMKDILEVSKRLLTVYQQLIQAKITKDMDSYRQNLDKIRKIRVEEIGLYSKIDKKNISLIMKEIQAALKSFTSKISKEEKLICNRIMGNLRAISMSTPTPEMVYTFASLPVSEKDFPLCADVLLSISNEIDLLYICYLEEIINKNNIGVNTAITNKLQTFYVYPLLETEYLDTEFEVGIPTLSSAFVASNGGLSKDAYEALKKKASLEKYNACTSDFYQIAKKNIQNEETFLRQSIVLCYIRASLQFMSKEESKECYTTGMSQLHKITNNPKIVSLFSTAFTSYDKDRTKFAQLYPNDYHEEKNK